MPLFVVLNINANGQVVAQIVEVDRRNERGAVKRDTLCQTEAILERGAQLGGFGSGGAGYRIVGISGPLPSVYGQGASVIKQVTVTPPAPQPPMPDIHIGPSAKHMADFYEPKY